MHTIGIAAKLSGVNIETIRYYKRGGYQTRKEPLLVAASMTRKAFPVLGSSSGVESLVFQFPRSNHSSR